MLKIGEFSKLSHITVKALRFYEKESILKPASIDKWTGYRFYTPEQLIDATKIKSYRSLGLSIDEIRSIQKGADESSVLKNKMEELRAQKISIEAILSKINSILEEKEMTYQVSEKIIPQQIVYSSETTLKSYSDIMEWIPSVGAACMELNPDIKCAEPPYEFCEYLDDEYKETDIRIRHNEAVDKFGKENDIIKFRTLPEAKVLSTFHKGPYETIGNAYSFIIQYARDNGYQCAGALRESYIDGIWNKESPDEWLTEVQLPIK